MRTAFLFALIWSTHQFAPSARAQGGVQAATTSTRGTGTSPADVPEKPIAEDEEPASPERLQGVTAALIPGLLLHGSGHFVAGDRQTARRLVALEGIGLGMATAGGLVLGLTGASRYIVAPSIPMLVTGIGMFALSWAADVYGVTTGGSEHRYHEPAPAAVSLGYGYVHDPQFAYDHFSVVAGSFATGRLHMDTALWTALSADNQRARITLRTPLFEESWGMHIEASVGGVLHRFADDGFATYVAEAALRARMDLAELGPWLAGSYLKASAGFGVQHFHYFDDTIEGNGRALLLSRWAFGVHLPAGGELEFYYDHRRDTFTAGASPGSGNGSGFMGQWGAKLDQPVSRRLGLTMRSEIGSAWLSTLGLEFRWGQ